MNMDETNRNEPRYSQLHMPNKAQIGFVASTLLTSGVISGISHSGLAVCLGVPLAYLAYKRSRSVDVDGMWDRLKGLSPSSDEPKDERLIARIEDNEREEESDLVHLGPNIDLDLDELLAQRIGIFGVSGAGKSNTVAVLLEEFGRQGVPLVVFDTEDENERICTPKYFTNPLHVTSADVTPASAFEFGQQIMDEMLQVVVNLQSYETDEEAAYVMIGIIEGINDWEEALPNGERVPCEIVLDEASYWLPQNLAESMLGKVKDETGQTVLTLLQQCFFRKLVRRGRKRGMGFIFATQRPAELDKRAIGCQWLILHRQTLKNDLEVYRTFGLEDDLVLALANGEAFIVRANGATKNYQIRQRRSPGGGATPGKKALKQYRSSHSHSPLALPAGRAQKLPVLPQGRERVNEPAERVNDREYPVNLPSVPETPVNATMKVTAAHKEQILKAYIAMQIEGLAINRTALNNYLGWNKRQYGEILKPALDEMDMLKSQN